MIEGVSLFRILFNYRQVAGRSRRVAPPNSTIGLSQASSTERAASLGLLRVAVLARSLDDGKRFRIDLRLTEDPLVGSGNTSRPEGMNQ